MTTIAFTAARALRVGLLIAALGASLIAVAPTSAWSAPLLRTRSPMNAIVIVGHANNHASSSTSAALLHAAQGAMSTPGTREEGHSLARALTEASQDQDFVAVVNKVESAYPKLFVDAGFVPADHSNLGPWGSQLDDPAGYDAWITLVSEPPTEVLKWIRDDQSLRTQLRLGAPMSADELEDVTSSLMSQLTASVDVTAASVRVRDGAIEVRYRRAPGTQAPADLERAALSLTAAHSIDGTLPLAVRLVEDPDMAPSQASTVVNAGHTLTSDSGNCTSGFSATRAGETGIITAAHCPNGLHWLNQDLVISFVTEADALTVGSTTATVDLQYHRTLGSNTAAPTFWNGANNYYVVAVGSPVLNESVCKYGVTTGDTCGSVTSTTNECQFYDMSRWFCGLWRANYVSDHGDSGGPVYDGSAARGIVSGMTLDYSVKFFTPIGRTARELSASVIQH